MTILLYRYAIHENIGACRNSKFSYLIFNIALIRPFSSRQISENLIIVKNQMEKIINSCFVWNVNFPWQTVTAFMTNKLPKKSKKKNHIFYKQKNWKKNDKYQKMQREKHVATSRLHSSEEIKINLKGQKKRKFGVERVLENSFQDANKGRQMFL